MKEDMKKKIILVIVSVILAIAGISFTVNFDNNNIEINTNTVNSNVIVTEETKAIAEETKQASKKDKDLSTNKVIKSTIKEEQKLEEEQLEKDAQVEQENISYDGTNSGKGKKLLGKYQGLTYYSQADKRWANKLYTSTNNKSQTMKSSACGPTCSAMIVSSSKGTILPTTVAKLFVDNGYRTANNGTAWSAYSFVADYFGFKEYYNTSNFDKAMNYLAKKRSDKSSKYYIIASCGSGLFTTGGHYIVLTNLDKNNITVYDPYVYTGKFNTASRKKAKVKLKNNIAYVGKTNFKKYANYKQFWIFSNDSTIKKANKKTTTKKVEKIKNTEGKTKKLKSKCYLYSKSNLTGKKYTYKKNTTVIIQKNISTKVDKVKVKYTGRIAYIKNNTYK